MSCGNNNMPVWLFIFTDPSQPILSCRVCAPTKADACLLVDPSMNAKLNRPAEGVIVQHAGYIELDEPTLLNVKFRTQEEAKEQQNINTTVYAPEFDPNFKHPEEAAHEALQS